MKSFKDKDGRDWSIVIDIAAVKAVRDLVKVDLYALFADEAKRLFTDPPLMVDTLYVLCRQQAGERKMSDVDFGRAMSDGDVLEAAANQLIEEMINFFPQSRRRILRATVDKSQQLAEEMSQTALATIERIALTDLLMPTAPPVS